MHHNPPGIILIPGGPGLPPVYYRELEAMLGLYQNAMIPWSAGEFPKSIEQAAEQLGQFALTLDAPPLLVGHSYGGAVVIEALISGVAAKAAIVISGFDSGRMLRDGIHSRIQNLPAGFHEHCRPNGLPSAEDASSLLFEYWLPAHFCRRPLPDSLQRGLAEIDQTFMTHFIGANFFDPDGAITQWDRSAAIARIDVPVLLLGGMHDYFRLEDVNRMRNAIPDCRAWIGPESSHNCWVEEPEEVRTAIRRFIGELTRGPD